MNVFNNNANSNNNKGNFIDGMLYVKDLASGETRCIGSVYTRSPVAEVTALLNAVNAHPDKLGLVFEDRRSNISANSFLGQVIASAKPQQVAQPQYIVAPQPVLQPQQLVQPQIAPQPVIQSVVPPQQNAGMPLGQPVQQQQPVLQPVTPDEVPF